MRSKALVALVFVLITAAACSPARIASAPAQTSSVPTAGASQPASASPAEVADVIFLKGVIITMEAEDPAAEAIAIRGDRILTVGSRDSALMHRGATTTVVDLGGLTLVPGFIDSHAHRIGDREMAAYTTPDAIIQKTIEQGWTSIDELYVHQPRLDELRALDQEGRLRLRVNAYLPLASPQGDPFGDWYQAYQPGFEYSQKLRLAGVKITLDHGWGLGKPLFEQEELDQMVANAHRLGWQIAVHTLSETAHEMILDSFERALGGSTGESYRHRIEHVLVASDEEIQRMQKMGIIACVQLWGSEWVEAPDFYEKSNPTLFPKFVRTRDLLDGGVVVVGSTDWPYGNREEPGAASPMLSLYLAATQAGSYHRDGVAWLQPQAIPVEQALQLLTINGAYATFEEHEKGSLAPGKFADMVVLSQNPLTSSIEAVPEIAVLMTMIAGRVEYCAAGNEAVCPGAEASVEQTPSGFTGTWMGQDPDDGSTTTITLIQSGDTLTGTFSDSYSGSHPPPGYEGTGRGELQTSTTAQMTFQLSRYDGATAELTATLVLLEGGATLSVKFPDSAVDLILKRQ